MTTLTRDEWLAVAGTIALMGWSVVSALMVTPAALGLLLVTISLLLPIVGWTTAAYVWSHRRERLLISIFTAEFLMSVLVDVIRWAGH